jgi:hypothetical protein
VPVAPQSLAPGWHRFLKYLPFVRLAKPRQQSIRQCRRPMTLAGRRNEEFWTVNLNHQGFLQYRAGRKRRARLEAPSWTVLAASAKRPAPADQSPILKLMFGTLILNAWRGLRFTEFELRQIAAFGAGHPHPRWFPANPRLDRRWPRQFPVRQSPFPCSAQKNSLFPCVGIFAANRWNHA